MPQLQRCSEFQQPAKEIRSTILTQEEEAMVVAFRQFTLLPLDEPVHITTKYSVLDVLVVACSVTAFPDFPIRLEKSHRKDASSLIRLAISILILPKSRRKKATRMTEKDFLCNLIAAVPYAIHTILTDNGIQFSKREGTEAYWAIPFDQVCMEHDIEHRLTQICHPWTNGQVDE